METTQLDEDTKQQFRQVLVSNNGQAPEPEDSGGDAFGWWIIAIVSIAMGWYALYHTHEFFKYIFPPVFYGFHGWIATRMAVGALFRPYRAWYWPLFVQEIWVTLFFFSKELQVVIEKPLPLTPGIFPKRKAKLAQAVASTVTDTLLTPGDIKRQAESLVTEQNIFSAIDVFVDGVLKEFRDTAKLHRLAQDIAELSPAFLQHFVQSLIEGVEQGKDKKVAVITEKIFDQMILSLRIAPDQAREIANRIMEAFVTPSNIRNSLTTLLSPQNINALDESIQAHAGGPYKILARIIGVKRVCYEWRNYLEKEPDESQKIISDLVKRFGIRDQIAVQIANFHMRSLPLQTIANFRENTIAFVESFLVDHRTDLLESVQRIENEAMGMVRAAIIKFNPESIPSERLVRAKHDLAVFAHAYLKRELGGMLEKAIPALGMYSLIAHKIELFSPQQLEILVKRICKRELSMLEWLGGIIGLFLGLIQIFVNIYVLKLP